MSSYLKVLLLAFCFIPSVLSAQDKITISGEISDESNGETLIGATVFVKELSLGTATNIYGFYSITLDPGTYTLKVSFIGYEPTEQVVTLDSDTRQDFRLSPQGILVNEAVIEGESTAEENVGSVNMSTVNMQMEMVKKIPAFMGEVDVIKAIQLLPGVQAAGEGSSGFHVRGGSVDQNLILLDESPVYNASHLLGFFSVFNSNAIKEMQLYKGGIPSRYGGRLASVLDIRMKDGNNKTWHAEGGIGSVSSRLTVEGPIVKDRGSILLAGRRSYADIFLLASSDPTTRQTKLYFYDLNLKANYKVNENNRLYLSGYNGRDVFGFGDQFSFGWGNSTGTARWNHIYNSKLFSNVTLTYSDYDYKLEQVSDEFGFLWESNITDLTGKVDYNYFINPQNTLQFGGSVTWRELDPGFARGTGEDSFLGELRMPITRSRDYALYISNEQRFGEKFTVSYGLRYALFQNVGEGTIFEFDNEYNVVDSAVYGKGEVYQTYGGFEPRIGVNYRLNERSSIKASYNRTQQFIQMATNSTSSSPLDVWFSASPNVKPQIADQYAIGYFRNFFDNKLEASVEAYYKQMQNTIDFANHAQLLLNRYLEGELRVGESRAYGIEFLVRKQTGKITGLASYTLARSERLIPEIQSDWYASNFDRTHDVSVVVAYELNKKWSFGMNWVYSTGNAVTMPTGRFEYMGMIVPVYSDRNGERMPAYHRLDFSATLTPKKNETRKWKGEWVFSIYNAYNRHNAYSINFVQDENDPNTTYAEQTYLLPVVPAVTYNFKF
ncbi:TonB-dependent receptor [Sanyastnella coralliicola]|uniref:TonB-dependent receptor n=1 Tax=Sanyastnella coralliicola TaxID=3069118 RepID=UPI0027BA1762|nr:TonB-dependent receptor [Longitalea sp. SCSIO 12813]